MCVLFTTFTRCQVCHLENVGRGQRAENNHALIAAKITPISIHVFVCGCEILPPRNNRMSAAAVNATASTARM
jgi:hypothetical protein